MTLHRFYRWTDHPFPQQPTFVFMWLLVPELQQLVLILHLLQYLHYVAVFTLANQLLQHFTELDQFVVRFGSLGQHNR
jgi:hypothetical protein